MAIEVGSSSPPILPPDVNPDPALSYSRHYAKKIHDLGKVSRESWIQTLVDHVLHGPQSGRANQRRGGRGTKGDREMEKALDTMEQTTNIYQRRKDNLTVGFDLAGATSRRNGRIMNSLNESPYQPKVKIPQEAPMFLRKIVQTREGYRENHLRGNITARSSKDDDRESLSSSLKAHNYPPIRNSKFRESKSKIIVPLQLASSPYVSNRQNIQIVPTEKVLGPRHRPRPQTRQSGGRNNTINNTTQRSSNPYLQSAPANSHSHSNHQHHQEAWRPSTLPPSAEQLALEKRAREFAAKAIKENKVFTCEAPYPVDVYVRFSMRKRGWVEKFAPRFQRIIQKATSLKLECELDEDFGDICDRKIPAPWDEDHGIYFLMSRLVRHRPARFIWAGRAVNSMVLHQDVIVNHFPKARHFSSKTGIASSLRDLPWLACSDPMDFFPRCYLLSEDERDDLIEDFRLCACISLLKWVVFLHSDPDEPQRPKTPPKPLNSIHKQPNKPKLPPLAETKIDKSQTADSQPCDLTDQSQPATLSQEAFLPSDPEAEIAIQVDDLVNDNNLDIGEDDGVNDYDPDFASPSDSDNSDDDDDVVDKVSSPVQVKAGGNKRIKPEITFREKAGGDVPVKAVDWALSQCERYIRFKTHDDLDARNKAYLSTSQWDQLLKWYDKVSEDDATVKVSDQKLAKVKDVLGVMRKLWKQFDIDGMHNWWIIKPGAKSKGIGIEFCTSIDEMMKYIDNTTVMGTYVVQKYIETPCLIFNTKFDIRQWFVVTDWNPLTIWFYKGSYLRICSQEFTMESMHESVHLSNVAIQQFYLNGEREGDLPDNNYMSSDQFEEYLASVGAPDAWEDIVYPGMISGVVNTLLATSDIAENKKAAFELYGADFMMDSNYAPWLLEINSSPGMAPSSREKAKMCATVVEDLMKVVLDRQENKTCDTGNFELVFKDQPMPTYKTTDSRIFIEGNRIKRTDLQRYASLDTLVKSGEDPAKNEFLKQLKKISKTQSSSKTSKSEPEPMKVRPTQKQDGNQGQAHVLSKIELPPKGDALLKSYSKIYAGSNKNKKLSATKNPLSRSPTKVQISEKSGKSKKDNYKKENSSLRSDKAITNSLEEVTPQKNDSGMEEKEAKKEEEEEYQERPGDEEDDNDDDDDGDDNEYGETEEEEENDEVTDTEYEEDDADDDADGDDADDDAADDDDDGAADDDNEKEQAETEEEESDENEYSQTEEEESTSDEEPSDQNTETKKVQNSTESGDDLNF